MRIYNVVEEPRFVEFRDTLLLERSLKSGYLFFVDILIQLHCGTGNANATIDFAGHYMPHNVDFEENEYSKIKRKKRGVMENIVSAYSQIVTKG